LGHLIYLVRSGSEVISLLVSKFQFDSCRLLVLGIHLEAGL
jgi:hypothetical protein